MTQADKDRLAELQKLAAELAENGDTDTAQQVAQLGAAMETQINEETQ